MKLPSIGSSDARAVIGEPHANWLTLIVYPKWVNVTSGVADGSWHTTTIQVDHGRVRALANALTGIADTLDVS
jgi:hypothetical protein